MPPPAPLPSKDAAAPRPTGGASDTGEEWHGAARGRGITLQEAVQAAQQVYVCVCVCVCVFVCVCVCVCVYVYI
jgi:hypothetical protein